jgi:hypothetical protein
MRDIGRKFGTCLEQPCQLFTARIRFFVVDPIVEGRELEAF